MCVCLWVLAGAGGRELVAGCLLDCLLDCLLLCLLDGMRAAYEDACSRLLLCLLDACLMLAWCFAGRRITLSGSQLASIGIVLGNGGHTRARASPSNEWRADAAPIAHIHTRARTHTLHRYPSQRAACFPTPRVRRCTIRTRPKPPFPLTP